MTPGDPYRVKAGDLAALARAESNPLAKAEYEKLSLSYLRLADQPTNSETDVVYETPPGQLQQNAEEPQQAQQHQQAQQQQQTQPDKK